MKSVCTTVPRALPEDNCTAKAGPSPGAKDSRHALAPSSAREFSFAQTNAQAAVQVLDRLRWWRTQRIGQLPLPVDHYVFNNNFTNYSSFATRPLSREVVAALRDVPVPSSTMRSSSPGGGRCGSDGLTSSHKLHTLSASLASGDHAIPSSSHTALPPNKAGAPTRRDDRCVATASLRPLYRRRAASAPDRRRLLDRYLLGSTTEVADNCLPIATDTSMCLFSVPEATPTPTHDDDADDDTVSPSLVNDSTISSFAVVLHHPPRLVLHASATDPHSALYLAHVPRDDMDYNDLMSERPEVFSLGCLPLWRYERCFYMSQLRLPDPGTPMADERKGRLAPSGVTGGSLNPTLPISTGHQHLRREGHGRGAVADSAQSPPTFEEAARLCRGRCLLRAASLPALPLADGLSFLKDRSRHHRGRRCVPCQKAPAGLPDPTRTTGSHFCRPIDSLQEAYVFHPFVDCIGTGAYSKVYAALPILRAGRSTGRVGLAASEETMPLHGRAAVPTSKPSTVALKVIPRRAKRRHVLLSGLNDGQEWRGGDASDATGQRHGTFRRPDVLGHPHLSGAAHAYQRCLSIPHRKDNSQRRELVEVEREISILRRLRHSGCSRFVEALRSPDEFVIAMHMREGSMDAREYLHRFGPPSEERVALLLFQLVSTIHYLHTTFGLIHRDIKLENVLISLIDAPHHTIEEVLGSHVHKADGANGADGGERAVYKDAASGIRRAGGTSSKRASNPAKATTSTTSATKNYRYSHSLGSVSVPNAMRMLHVTLIDFGFARRTYVSRRCSANVSMNAASMSNLSDFRREPLRGHNAGVASMASAHRMGMPTPMPSTANMFTGYYDAEEFFIDDSGVSSTDVSATETSSYDSAEEEGKAVLEGAANAPDDGGVAESTTSTLGVVAGRRAVGRTDAGEIMLVSAALPADTCGISAEADGDARLLKPYHSFARGCTGASPPLSPTTSPLSGPRHGVTPLETQRPVVPVASDRGSTPATPRLEVPRMPNSSVPRPTPLWDDGGGPTGSSTRGTWAHVREGMRLRRVASEDVAARGQAFSTRMPLRSSPQQAMGAFSYHLSGLDDEEATLLLTPCGTDRYLPPEMLEWMVAHASARKPTTVGMARKLDMYAIGTLAYVLLSGCFPFNGATRASLAQQQKRVPACNSARWTHVSAEAVNFVQYLLSPDPTVRPSAGEALEHPFLKQAAQWAKVLDLIPMPEDGAAHAAASTGPHACACHSSVVARNKTNSSGTSTVDDMPGKTQVTGPRPASGSVMGSFFPVEGSASSGGAGSGKLVASAAEPTASPPDVCCRSTYSGCGSDIVCPPRVGGGLQDEGSAMRPVYPPGGLLCDCHLPWPPSTGPPHRQGSFADVPTAESEPPPSLPANADGDSHLGNSTADTSGASWARSTQPSTIAPRHAGRATRTDHPLIFEAQTHFGVLTASEDSHTVSVHKQANHRRTNEEEEQDCFDMLYHDIMSAN